MNQKIVVLPTAETICSRVEECRKHLKASQFYEDFTEAWKNAIGNETKYDIQEIVCYGIGTFSQTSNYSGPLWQISFVLTMQTYLKNNLLPKRITFLWYIMILW